MIWFVARNDAGIINYASRSSNSRTTEAVDDGHPDIVAFLATPAAPIKISYEAFQSRFTAAEFDAATDFVYETNLATGKPKRRALIQGLSRAMAKNSIDLLDARTTGFLDALVAGGVVTVARKAAILAP